MNLLLLDKASAQSPIVYQMRKNGSSLEEIILALVNHQSELIGRLMRLEAIAPRKFVVGNVTYDYRCPEELIPIIEVPPETSCQGLKDCCNA